MIIVDVATPTTSEVLATFRGARVCEPVEHWSPENTGGHHALRLKSDLWGMTKAIVGEVEDANYPIPDPSEPSTFVAVEKLRKGGASAWVPRRRGHGITFGEGRKLKNLSPVRVQ